MAQAGREGGAARERDGAKRNRAAWLKPAGREAQPSHPFLIQFLYNSNHRIQHHRHNAQQHNGHKEPIHFKEVKGQKDKMTIVFLWWILQISLILEIQRLH